MPVKRKQAKPLTARQVGDCIDIPVLQWPGRCAEIVAGMLRCKLVLGRACYGLWKGPIHPESLFGGRPFSRHAWIVLVGGQVCDPTRWVFEYTAPYIYTGPSDHYDFGANEFRREFRVPPPAYDACAPELSLRLKPEAWRCVCELLKHPVKNRRLNACQVFWLANVTLDELGEHAKAVYTALRAAGKAVWIPYDNREFILGDLSNS